jgi:hypothetical protein
MVLMWSCSPIDATHPLDPDTPRERQATSSIIGSLTIPNRFDENLVTQVVVHLDPLEENRPSYRVSTRMDTRFVIPEVMPGQYRFYCQGPGVQIEPFFINAIAGAELDLGALLLEPIIGVIRGTAFSVFGTPAAGAIVSADDEFDATITNTEGEFALRVFAGQRVIALSIENYYTWASSPIDIREGGEVVIEDPIFMLPINGTLQGSVKLRQYATDARSINLQFELRPQVMDLSEDDERFTCDN